VAVDGDHARDRRRRRANRVRRSRPDDPGAVGARADLDLTALFSQLPILAAVRRINIAAVVRERST
jgi:hypothetical protein